VSTDIWPLVRVEREALIRDLKTLPAAEAWDTPSLCAGWTVRDVVAHMASTAAMTPPKFFAGFLGSGFNFDKFVTKGIAAERGASAQDTLDRFESLVSSTSSPPGPKVSWLGETVIHAEDIRFPLGLEHDHDPAAVRAVADFYKGSNTLIGAKNRIRGLQLKATDTDWSTGSGELVEGTLLGLLMAMTGRKPYLDKLTGPGVEVLRSR